MSYNPSTPSHWSFRLGRNHPTWGLLVSHHHGWTRRCFYKIYFTLGWFWMLDRFPDSLWEIGLGNLALDQYWNVIGLKFYFSLLVSTKGSTSVQRNNRSYFPVKHGGAPHGYFNWTIKCTPILLGFSVDLFCTLSIVRHVHPKLLQTTYLLSAKPFSRICYSEVFLVFTIWNQIASGEKWFLRCPKLSLWFPGTWTLQPWSTRGTRPTAGKRSRSPPPW